MHSSNLKPQNFLSDIEHFDYTKHCPFDCEVPGDCGYEVKMTEGVIQVISCKGEGNSQECKIVHPFPDLQEFFDDQNVLLALSTHGPM